MSIEQHVVIVAANESDINDAITAQNEGDFFVVSITPSGTDVIILSQKVITD